MRHRTIAINGRYLTQPLTGVQRFATEIVRALDREIAERRIELHGARVVLAAPPGSSLPALRAIEAIRVGRLTGHAWEQLEFPRALRGALKVSLCGAAPITGAGQIVTFHDAAIYSAPHAYTTAFRLWYKSLFLHQGRLARAVITVSEFSRRELSSRCGISLSKIEVVSPSAQHILDVVPDHSVLTRFNLGDRGYALSVGSVQSNKNLRILESLPGESPQVVVVGGGGQSFRGSALKAGRLKFIGRVSDSKLSALYRHACCFISASRYEGFGIPALEAMHCGCPVIAAKAAATPETCGNAALYFDPDSAGELAAQIERVQGEAQNLVQLGRARAAEYTWQRSAQKLWAVIQKEQA